jgi:hypothetical protein
MWPAAPKRAFRQMRKTPGESFAHLSGSSGKATMGAFRRISNDQKSKIDASMLLEVQNSKFNLNAAIVARFSRYGPPKGRIFQSFPP